MLTLQMVLGCRKPKEMANDLLLYNEMAFVNNSPRITTDWLTECELPSYTSTAESEIFNLVIVPIIPSEGF